MADPAQTGPIRSAHPEDAGPSTGPAASVVASDPNPMAAASASAGAGAGGSDIQQQHHPLQPTNTVSTVNDLPAGGGSANTATMIDDGAGGAGGPSQASPSQQRRSGEGEVGSITPPVPKCHLRVLVISGQSHVFSFEPETTVGRMKELIWSSWPSEWTSPAAPPSPAYLRVLYSGRILQDDATLSSNNILSSPQSTNPTVVHISVRSFSIKGDEDPKKGFLHPTTSRSGRQGDDVGGCKCVIM